MGTRGLRGERHYLETNMASKKATFGGKKLTALLREIALEAHDWSEEHGAITKGEALARLLFRRALGWEEVKISDEGERSTIKHPSEFAAMSLIYDRLEGKTPMALPEADQRVKTLQKVRDLAKLRVNGVTAAVNKAKSTPPPPPHRSKDRDA